MNETAGFVLDASVLVAFMRPGEPFHADADALLKELTLPPFSIIVPAIVFAEVGAALARGENDTSLALQAVTRVSQLRGLRIVSIDEALGGAAAHAAVSYRIRGCDAIYVALALTLNTPLITLDRQQRERSPNTVISLTPGEALAEFSR